MFLKSEVAIESTPGVLTTITGIPPHIETACALEKVEKGLNALIAQSKYQEESQKQCDTELKNTILTVVKDGIEQKPRENGNVTASILNDIIQKHTEATNKTYREELKRVSDQITGILPLISQKEI